MDSKDFMKLVEAIDFRDFRRIGGPEEAISIHPKAWEILRPLVEDPSPVHDWTGVLTNFEVLTDERMPLDEIWTGSVEAIERGLRTRQYADRWWFEL